MRFNFRAYCWDYRIQQGCLLVSLAQLQLDTYSKKAREFSTFILKFTSLQLIYLFSLICDFSYCRFLEWCVQGFCCIIHNRHTGMEYIFNWGKDSWLKRVMMYMNAWPIYIAMEMYRKRDTMEVFTKNRGLHFNFSPFVWKIPLKWVCF